jgi:hypothetical protein
MYVGRLGLDLSHLWQEIYILDKYEKMKHGTKLYQQKATDIKAD